MPVIPKNRLEFFSDAVIAIIITIMVLEFKAPHGADLAALRPVLPQLLVYTLSFVTLGIYWNNHHHLLNATKHINGAIMWANLNLLFWSSLVPYFTIWLGENYREAWPTAVYGALQLICGASYQILERKIIIAQGKNSSLAERIGRDLKGRISLGLFALAIILAFVNTVFSDIIFVLVAATWFIPDRRLVGIS